MIAILRSKSHCRAEEKNEPVRFCHAGLQLLSSRYRRKISSSDLIDTNFHFSCESAISKARFHFRLVVDGRHPEQNNFFAKPYIKWPIQSLSHLCAHCGNTTVAFNTTPNLFGYIKPVVGRAHLANCVIFIPKVRDIHLTVAIRGKKSQ
jgi:hypothetical protein